MRTKDCKTYHLNLKEYNREMEFYSLIKEMATDRVQGWIRGNSTTPF